MIIGWDSIVLALINTTPESVYASTIHKLIATFASLIQHLTVLSCIVLVAVHWSQQKKVGLNFSLRLHPSRAVVTHWPRSSLATLPLLLRNQLQRKQDPAPMLWALALSLSLTLSKLNWPSNQVTSQHQMWLWSKCYVCGSQWGRPKW